MITIRRISIIGMFLLISAPFAVRAEHMIGSENIQTCSTNEQCTLVSQTCSTSCASLPVNSKFVEAMTEKRTQECGSNVSALPTCVMNPPLHAACINNRCTIDYAFQHNSHDGDYKNGGYQGHGAQADTVAMNQRSTHVAPVDSPTVRSLGTLTQPQ